MYVNLLLLLFVLVDQCTAAADTHFVYWNSTNPIFRLDNHDNVLEVNQGSLPTEHDQLHIICPNSREQHVIYSVSEDEYFSCRVSNPRPKIVALCNQPERFRYFTITFRSFSPNPTALEFKPGQSYYLISTSTPMDLHRRAGGYCSTHNMKMMIKVGAGQQQQETEVMTAGVPVTASPITSPIYRAITTERYTTTSNSIPVYYYRSKTPSIHSSDYIYYYSPRDLIQLKMKAKKHDKSIRIENETYRAQRLRSSSSNAHLSLVVLLASVLSMLLRC